MHPCYYGIHILIISYKSGQGLMRSCGYKYGTPNTASPWFGKVIYENYSEQNKFIWFMM